MYQRLYINIDHVATLRQARRTVEPDPVLAATECENAGADGITAHLREDRRHIQDHDVERLATSVRTVLNLEMAFTAEMLAIAERVRPYQVTFVPERREEITTEGGLDVSRDPLALRAAIERLNAAGIRTSLFIDPDLDQIRAAHKCDADEVELHTGRYCEARNERERAQELSRVVDAAKAAAKLGMKVAAGHGLNYDNVQPIAAIPQLAELNIGHYLVGEAVFVGLEEAVRRMRELMDAAR